MRSEKAVIAIAGAGDMAKYFIEEIENDGQFDCVVLTRTNQNPTWFTERPSVRAVLQTDYSVESVKSILDEHAAFALFAFWVSWDPKEFVRVHNQLIDACLESRDCKKYHGSELIGDIRKWPQYPHSYPPSRGPIRERLQKQNDIQWTAICGGTWLDYFVPPHKSYLRHATSGDAPMLDFRDDKFVFVQPGTGDEPIGVTAFRDAMQAAVAICKLETWENYYYVVGENSTWNNLVQKLEQFYGRTFDRQIIDISQNEHTLEQRGDDAFIEEVYQWYYKGATYIEPDLVLEHRKKYFSHIKFRTLDDLLRDDMEKDKI